MNKAEALKAIVEVAKGAAELASEFLKFNPNHGSDGRFSSSGGGGGAHMAPDTGTQIGGGGGGGIPSGKEVRKKIESVTGDFSEGTAKRIGKRVSRVKGVFVKSAKEGSDLVKKIGDSLKEMGFKEFQGKTKAQTVWGTKNQEHVVSATKVKAGKTHSVRVEMITTE